jgi:hypothetical protein
LSDALIRTLPLIVAWFLADWILRWKRRDKMARTLKAMLFLFFVFGIADLKSFAKTPWHALEVSLGRLFFPQDMMLYVGMSPWQPVHPGGIFGACADPGSDCAFQFY